MGVTPQVGQVLGAPVEIVSPLIMSSRLEHYLARAKHNLSRVALARRAKRLVAVSRAGGG